MAKSQRKSVRRELRVIRRALSSVIAALERLGPILDAARSAGPRTGRKLRLSPERRAALKLQGQYMGYLRNLKPVHKARAKALRAAKGIRPAIKLARELAGA